MPDGFNGEDRERLARVETGQVDIQRRVANVERALYALIALLLTASGGLITKLLSGSVS